MKYLVLLLIIASCGGTHKVEFEPPKEDIISGETYSYIIVRVEYISDIKEQCTNLYPEYEFDMSNQQQVQERDKLIAECFFDNMPDINIGDLQNFNDEVCSKPIEEQTEDEQQICEALNG